MYWQRDDELFTRHTEKYRVVPRPDRSKIEYYSLAEIGCYSIMCTNHILNECQHCVRIICRNMGTRKERQNKIK